MSNNRELKFRVWRKLKGELYFSIFDLKEIGDLIVLANEMNDFLHFDGFTGLSDKNGKEIYEGDIFKQKYFEGFDYNPELITKFNYRNGKIYWAEGNASFAILWGNQECHFGLDVPGLEVVGNIYMNPKLVKK